MVIEGSGENFPDSFGEMVKMTKVDQEHYADKHPLPRVIMNLTLVRSQVVVSECALRCLFSGERFGDVYRSNLLAHAFAGYRIVKHDKTIGACGDDHVCLRLVNDF